VYGQCLQRVQVHKEFSKRTRLDRKVYEKVSARWQELGLPGLAPRIESFEDEEIERLSDGLEKQGNL